MFGQMINSLRNILNLLVPGVLALAMGIGVIGISEMFAQQVEEPIPMPVPDESQIVSVELNDSEITIPEEIEAGKVTFEVKNNGEREHGFAIEGQGVESMVEGNIPPGETKRLEVNLTPGSYRVYCPEQPDMTRDITVVGREG